MKWAGFDNDDNVVIIDLLGPSLEDLFVYCGRRFSLKTVLMLAEQMVIRQSFLIPFYKGPDCLHAANLSFNRRLLE